MKQYNILIYGAGAVGIFFGGKLHQAGFNTVFVDTSERVETLKQGNLVIRSRLLKDYEFQPLIVDDVSDLPAQDIILICVKAFQTYDIAMNLIPVVKPTTIIMSMQSGLENERVLSDLLGSNLIMGTVLYYNGILENDYTVAQKAPAEIIFGEVDHQGSRREEWLSEVLSHADISHKISRSINREIWKKFIWNNAYNSVSALTGSTVQQIYNSERIRSTIRQMMNEVQQVAEAEGIQLPGQVLEEMVVTSPEYADIKPSMLKDIESARMPEIEALVGVLIQKAEKHGISVPVNQTVYNLIKLILANANIKPEN